METDPNYEYEAPKWFDFTEDFESEVNDNPSLDDSWFERVHPLHEPRDASYHDATAKPLLSCNQSKKVEPSDVKPQPEKPAKKNYNSKKSLGIKTIRTRRGQHDNQNNQEGGGSGVKSEKSHLQKTDRQVSLKDGKKDSSGNSKDGRFTPDEILHNKHCGFTPTWANSPLRKTEEVPVPHSNKGKGSSSSLSDEMLSPRHLPVNHSPMSPARVRTLKSSSSSMSPCSPKTSLLSKAVSGTCQQGGRKRRLLPSIPDLKHRQADSSGISSSDQSSNQLPDGANKNSTSVSQKSSEKTSMKEVVLCDNVKPLRATDTCVNLGTSNQAQYADDIYKQDKKLFSQRPLHAIPENSSSKGTGKQAFASTESKQQSSLKCETETSNDKSLEKLLKMHNKKIFSARSQYDENGRKIRTAEPSFCPAPSETQSSSLSSSVACKRPATSVDKPMVSVKQKRRSCMASVSNAQSEITKSSARSISANINTNINKKGKESLNQQTVRQKRRSCTASLQNNGGQTSTADRELRDLIAQHNSRVSAKRS